MSRILEINQKIEALMDFASKKWSVEFPHIHVRFDLRGLSAGQAIRKSGEYSVRFNIDMINGDSFDYIKNETVPHEIAHIICLYLGWDKGHGKIWKTVCNQLGGTGKTCHNEKVSTARNMKSFLYNTTCGTTVVVSNIRHNKIQKGVVYKLPSTGGSLIRDSWTQMA